MTIETVTLGHLHTHTLKIVYDEGNDVIEICGIRYHCDVFRKGLNARMVGRWFRIDESKDGDLTLRCVTPTLEKEFDRMAGVE